MTAVRLFKENVESDHVLPAMKEAALEQMIRSNYAGNRHVFMAQLNLWKIFYKMMHTL